MKDIHAETVALAARPPDVTVRAAPQVLPKPEGNNRTVLIVEDDEGVARLEQRRLERAGFKALVAGSAEIAAELLGTNSVDIILLDYKLPHGVDGLDFYTELKARGVDLPVILVTGFGNETLIIKALRVGVRDYITKSYEYLDYLPEAVGRVLKQIEMERRLAESEARLTSVIQSAKDAILVADEDQRISLFNPAAEKMFRCPADQALGQLLSRFFRAEFPSQDLTGASASSLTLQVESWTRGVRADGDEFPLEASISRAEAAGRVIHTVLVRDITERRRAEEQIRAQAALLEKATDAVFVCDMSDRIVFWNRAAERLYGWERNDALGRAWPTFLVKTRDAAFEEANRVLLEKGEWNGEITQVTRDGREIIVDSRRTLMRDEGKQPKSKLVINTDITQYKKMQAQLLRAQRLESLGTLAGGIAHDLNNILTPLMMSVEILRGHVTEPNGLLMLATLRTSTQRAADLVKQILAFARGAPAQRLLLQLPPMFSELCKLLRQTFPKNVSVDFAAAPGLWNIEGDATQIHQVLMNLCVNARDAMPAGGRLTVSAQNVRLDEHTVHLHPDATIGPYVVLVVEDTGAGIAPAVLDKIFDPFFTTKEVGNGTGLGLSTVIGITRNHAGFITVYSEVGRGSQFKVYLPAMPDELHSERAAGTVTLPLGRGECLLLVDDEVAILHLGKAILESNGYRILTATNGQDALAIFLANRQDVRLVITDLAMPQLDGRATIRRLRALDLNVPIVATSGFLSADTHDADLVEIQGVLSKPYSALTLLTMVHNILTGSSSAAGPKAEGGSL